MKKRNVLIFPAGTEIGLEIFNSLKFCKDISLFAAGQDVSNHAQFLYPSYHIIPSIHEDNWVEELNEVCVKNNIDYIFPAYDDVIVALAEISHKINPAVITSPLEAVLVTRSKRKTYERLSSVVRVPALYSLPCDNVEFPLLVKPDRGQGSSGVTVVNNAQELEHAVATVRDPLVCEYLPGDEYTVDCFSDRDGGVLFSGARERRRTRNGISVNTITKDFPEVQEMALKINLALNMRGAWFFQIKRDRNNDFALLEVAPRIAGSMACHRMQGINFPLLSIYEEERIPISILKNEGVVELDRALSNRYRHSIKYSTVYLDFDDTLILDGKVNSQVISFVFQSINNGRRVVLLTRHRGDLSQALSTYRLSGLFDEIIHIGKDDKKSKFILDHDSIFVDDSFSERMDVHLNNNIPTFDCSMLDLLLD